jgi:hypothetical protein
MKFAELFLATQFFTLIAALTTIRGLIPPSPQLPNPSSLPADTTLTLTTSGATHSTRLRADNTFAFRNVSEGSYILDTHCSTHQFPPLRVDVARDGEVKVSQTFRGNPWSNVGERRSMPIVHSPLFFPLHGRMWADRRGGATGTAAAEAARVLCHPGGFQSHENAGVADDLDCDHLGR